MKKIRLIIIISILNLNFGLAQTESEIDALLNGIAKTENSKGITKTEQAEKIITYGEKSLLILAEFFTDSTQTKVKSECQERNLTKGEIAIIMADQIQRMPYAQLTGIQNCLLTFCENNPNWIEYYLWAIKRDGTEKFQEKYRDWIAWTKLSDKEKLRE
jgi:hypothetical protein